MSVFQVEANISLLVLVALLVLKGFTFISALLYPAQAYPAADRGTKAAWCIGLGLGFVAQVLLVSSPLNLIHLAFTIAALVYLVDVRPRLAEVTQRR